MRTTIDLPDDLVRAARVRAAEGDESLKELFTRALANELGRTELRHRGQLPVIASKAPGRSRITPAELERSLIDDDVAGLDRLGQ